MLIMMVLVMEFQTLCQHATTTSTRCAKSNGCTGMPSHRITSLLTRGLSAHHCNASHRCARMFARFHTAAVQAPLRAPLASVRVRALSVYLCVLAVFSFLLICVFWLLSASSTFRGWLPAPSSSWPPLPASQQAPPAPFSLPLPCSPLHAFPPF